MDSSITRYKRDVEEGRVNPFSNDDEKQDKHINTTIKLLKSYKKMLQARYKIIAADVDSRIIYEEKINEITKEIFYWEGQIR